ncbi:TsaC protein (YrdC-Sua5 domains) required for threonylcarbamoyladenosine t(6)A37 modification in tRNA [Pseudoalteromonas luteoviolacea B = ATCC 29581]|nr:TsaC protein (YrdC-Sua5 domains) required for threonylcarbamoyladenosine t(6)A37 modification in tRNA [Pseudoalteromonas luteoviolacea B = ATCC 29581]
MKTEKLIDVDAVARAAKIIKSGELVAVPTETVYGLAADANNPDAVAKIFAAKGRPADHPLIVHIASAEHLTNWAEHIPDSAFQLAAAFWPGPLTFILPKKNCVNNVVTGGHKSVGVRCPAHPLMRELLLELNTGLAAPSANPYKKISPTTAEQVLFGLEGKIAAVLDGGPCEVGLESTILDLTVETPRILRAGPISKAQIEQVLGVEVLLPKKHNIAVSGNVKAHYQPNKPLYAFSTEELKAKLLQPRNDIAVLYYTATLVSHIEQARLPSLKLGEDKPSYAKGLYYGLFTLDKADIREIWLELPPQNELWVDVHDRLSRAVSN